LLERHRQRPTTPAALLGLLAPDDSTYDAWLKKKYGRNPYLKAPKVKVRRSSKRPRRS